MKSVKELNEQIDTLRYEAKGIFEAAKRASRELNEDEKKRFDEITDKKTGLIAGLKKQLSEAEDREAAILEMSVREQRQRALEEIDGEITTTAHHPPRVLPTNGVPAGQEKQDAGRVFVRATKLKAFKDEKTAHQSAMWMRAMIGREFNREDKAAELFCQRNGLVLTNVGTEGSGATGGYLVPTPLAQTIIDVREAVGIARRICSIQPMTSDTLSMARRAGGLTAYYGTENPGADMTTSDKTWQQIELVAKKRYVAHQISQELVDDALISVVDDAVSEMAYALADKEDAECINGDGTSTYGGVQGLISAIGSAGVNTAPSSHDTWGELDTADFTNTMGKLPEKYSRMPVWVCSANFYWSVMARIMLSGGGNNANDLAVGPNEGRFFGRTVYFTDKMPRSTAVSQICALFGTFSMGVILGDRMGVRMARSDDYKFLQDLTTLKATSRYDIKVHAPGDGSNAGAYVALETAAN